MQTHARAAVAPRSAPPSLKLEPPEPWAALLETLGDIEDEEHVLVLGRDGLDLMCALLRAGAPRVSHFRSHERLEPESASLVIVPQISSFEWLGGALPAIRRAMITNGRIVACLDDLPSKQNRIRRMLALNGFTAIRATRVTGRQAICAEVPMFGMRRCA